MNSGDNDLLYFELVQEIIEDKLLCCSGILFLPFASVFSISDKQ